MNKYQIVEAVARRLHNTSALEVSRALFPDAREGYLQEWAERFAAGFGYAVDHMDDNTLRRFVDQATEEVS